MPVSVCYESGISVSEAADIKNLKVISMKENYKNWEKFNNGGDI